MRKDLLRRLEKLEERRSSPEVMGVFWMKYVDRERRNTLAPNERIVEDWYLYEYGIQWVGERITTDPCDQGWNYRETENGPVIVSDVRRKITVIDGDPYYSYLINSDL